MRHRGGRASPFPPSTIQKSDIIVTSDTSCPTLRLLDPMDPDLKEIDYIQLADDIDHAVQPDKATLTRLPRTFPRADPTRIPAIASIGNGYVACATDHARTHNCVYVVDVFEQTLERMWNCGKVGYTSISPVARGVGTEMGTDQVTALFAVVGGKSLHVFNFFSDSVADIRWVRRLVDCVYAPWRDALCALSTSCASRVPRNPYGYDCCLLCYDLTTLKLLDKFACHCRRPTAVDVDEPRGFVATAADDGECLLFSLRSSRPLAFLKMPRKDPKVKQVLCVSDENSMYLESSSGVIRKFDVRFIRALPSPVWIQRVHKNTATRIGLDRVSDGVYVSTIDRKFGSSKPAITMFRSDGKILSSRSDRCALGCCSTGSWRMKYSPSARACEIREEDESERLEYLLMQLAAAETKRREDEIEELKSKSSTEIGDLRSKLREAEAGSGLIAAAKREATAAKLRIGSITVELEGVRTELDQMEEQCDKFSDQNVELEQTKAGLLIQNKELKRDLEDLMKRKLGVSEGHGRELDRLKEIHVVEIEGLRREIAAAKLRIGGADEQKRKVKLLEEERDSLNEKLVVESAQKARLEIESAELQERIAGEQAERRKLNELLRKVMRQLDDCGEKWNGPGPAPPPVDHGRIASLTERLVRAEKDTQRLRDVHRDQMVDKQRIIDASEKELRELRAVLICLQHEK